MDGDLQESRRLKDEYDKNTQAIESIVAMKKGNLFDLNEANKNIDKKLLRLKCKSR